MGGILGIFQRDDRPLSVVNLRRMVNSMNHRGPNGAAFECDGPVGLGAQMMFTTPESDVWESQPLRHRGAPCLGVFDGRIDNRDELITALGRQTDCLRNEPDLALVLEAYLKWGENCPRMMAGDFALAIWDRDWRHIFCARDAIGVKPFYYHLNNRTFLFASEITAIFAGSDLERRPNEGMVAEFLADAITNGQDTLYEGIQKLPPGYSLTVAPGSSRMRRYWDPGGRTLRYADTREYAEHLRDLCTKAVRSSLRAAGTVGVHLSGGLDSTIVTGLAGSLIASGAAKNVRLWPYSLAFPGRDCDEGKYIASAGAHFGMTPRIFTETRDCRPFSEHIRRTGYFPSPPNGRAFDLIRFDARKRGVRVMLSGIGGDEWLSGSDCVLADLLWRRELGPFMMRLKAGYQGSMNRMRAAYQYGLRPNLKDAIPAALLQWRPGAARRGVVSRSLARRVDLPARLALSEDGRGTFAMDDILRFATSGWQTLRFELEDRDDAAWEIEMRHPLNDRRIAEFALSLPDELIGHPGNNRALLRQAMRDLLPREIVERQTKADFSHLFPEALLASQSERVFRSLRIAENGWIDEQTAVDMHDTLLSLYRAGDQRYRSLNWKVWMTFGIELWFREMILKKHSTAYPVTDLTFPRDTNDFTN